MPQLDSATFLSQLVWLGVAFLLLYAILSHVTLPRIARILEERNLRISEDMDQATKLTEKASLVQEEYEAALAKAQAQSQQSWVKAGEQYTRRRESKQQQLEENLANHMAEISKNLHTAHLKAQDNLVKASVDTAALLYAKLIGKAPSKEDLEAAANKAHSQEPQKARV